MAAPRASVIIATRNRRDFLARALASVEAQSFRDFEIIVVDDASTDGTASWLRSTRPRLRTIELARRVGAAAARNRGVEASVGDVLAFLDDDDTWRPSYLGRQLAALDGSPSVELSSSGHVEIDRQGRARWPDLRPAADYESPLVHLLAECPIHTLSAVACHRSAWQRIGPFDEHLEIAHDLDWYARLLASGGHRTHVPEPLVLRGVPGGLVSRHRDWHAEDRAVRDRVFGSAALGRRERHLVNASRALLFARVGLGKGDLRFGVAQLYQALSTAPIVSLRLALTRARRYRRNAAVAAWTATATEPG